VPDRAARGAGSAGMYECGGGGAGGGLKEESSFSEEKEAKRLLSIGPGWWPAGRAIG
jgi:hypothetical protein